MRLNERQWVDLAYKKLKGALYFDKTQLPLLDSIVRFERDGLEKELENLAQLLAQPDDEKWEDFISDITSKIDVFVYPKKLEDYSNGQIIFNATDVPVKAEKVKYFIDMPVKGHLLGVLWILTIGTQIDKRSDVDKAWMYEHSYGNRLRKSLIQKEDGRISYSPHMFEAYFSQYESWRDKALSCAEERLDTHQDALILMLDLRDFYYSIDISEKGFNSIYDTFQTKETPRWAKPVHDFVYYVLKTFSEKVRMLNRDEALQLGNRVFLPIGFLPSNILANWFLTPFDKAISDRINPVYYGRYVDDIIIVDKIEKNSAMRRKACKEGDNACKLSAQDVIQHYFCNYDNCCPIFEIFNAPKLNSEAEGSKEDKGEFDYKISNSILAGEINADSVPDVHVQGKKVKVFYFREGSTRALLDCFRAEIGKNASEFRLLPDVGKLLRYNDYSEIFKLENKETPNKLRGITDLHVDRFALSKFLGKYRKAGHMIRDQKENDFDRNLTAFMDYNALIEHYILWERLLEIMVVNERLDYMEMLIDKILKAIDIYQVPPTLLEEEKGKVYAHKGLLYTLRAAICRTLALCWGPRVNDLLKNLSKIAGNIGEGQFNFEELVTQRKAYCASRMVNKYAMPIPLMASFDKLQIDDTQKMNLCHLEEMLKREGFTFIDEDDAYCYPPYIVRPQEIAFALLSQSIARGKIIDDPKKQKQTIARLYRRFNYPKSSNHTIKDFLSEIEVVHFGSDPKDKCCAISVKSHSKGKIKIAIGNAKLNMDDFVKTLKDRSNRSLDRYEQFNKLINAALAEKVDLLVLPENYLPWEWVPNVARICANNQMALITGVEHILSSERKKEARKVYNLTAIILPYKEDDYPFAHIVCHHKVHYSPEEKRQIRGYQLNPLEGEGYQLFHWQDLWFSVYCCYELASIKERSIFQSVADLTVAVEWNRDVGYFSNIIESICRDLHCYCVQVNSSDYGDSRVISPSKTNKRDLIKTKGGRNYTILVDEINISALRDFQRMEYELQHETDLFKPTPPNFETAIVRLKQQNTLWEYLKQKENDSKQESIE